MFHPYCKKVYLVFCLSIFFLLSVGQSMGTDRYEEDRRYMVQEIAQDARDTSYYINKKELDPRVMSAMGRLSYAAIRFAPWLMRIILIHSKKKAQRIYEPRSDP